MSCCRLPSSAFLQAEAERKAKPKKVRAKAKPALGKPGKGARLHPMSAHLAANLSTLQHCSTCWLQHRKYLAAALGHMQAVRDLLRTSP